ncbi:GNAT family N-acetyltransferase [Paludisphaera rhizosphaerae]|uniref:GNAT family N-acetyltransferase n=1 Tax=Paludisphaera rhizosphaerae TaxID=2711216 RepID=UPI0013EDF70A|nr:GNAT family N-acetyltransferase [Paludisphaera rhizosphaerae]
MAASNLWILRCPVEERPRALEVLYQGLERRVRAALVAEALEDARAGRVDLSGLWIARKPGWGTAEKLVGAILTQSLSGRAAAVWPPQAAASPWNRADVAEALVKGALAGLRDSGVAIAQAVLDMESDPRGAIDLARGGMPRVTDLVYMRRDTRVPPSPPARPPTPRTTLDWRGVEEAGDAVLRAVLTASYQGSLDMPEIEGARSLDDILEGHRGPTFENPERWRLGFLPGESEAVAALLLAAAADRDAWEVVYLGLAPRGRGRGLGDQAVTHALSLARPHAKAIELAVDARNAPAVGLYRRTGFVPFERRAVHLTVLARTAVMPNAGAPPLP